MSERTHDRTPTEPWDSYEFCGTGTDDDGFTPVLSIGNWGLCRTGTGQTEFWTGHVEDSGRPVPTPSRAAAVTWPTRQEAAQAAETLAHDGWAPINLNELED